MSEVGEWIWTDNRGSCALHLEGGARESEGGEREREWEGGEGRREGREEGREIKRNREWSRKGE